jgi:hypothetical protein
LVLGDALEAGVQVGLVGRGKVALEERLGNTIRCVGIALFGGVGIVFEGWVFGIVVVDMVVVELSAGSFASARSGVVVGLALLAVALGVGGGEGLQESRVGVCGGLFVVVVVFCVRLVGGVLVAVAVGVVWLWRVLVLVLVLVLVVVGSDACQSLQRGMRIPAAYSRLAFVDSGGAVSSAAAASATAASTAASASPPRATPSAASPSVAKPAAAAPSPAAAAESTSSSCICHCQRWWWCRRGRVE